MPYRRKDGRYPCPNCKRLVRKMALKLCAACYEEYREMKAILDEPNWSLPQVLRRITHLPLEAWRQLPPDGGGTDEKSTPWGRSRFILTRSTAAG